MKSHEQMLNEVESDLTVRIFNKGGSGEFISYEREKGYPEGTTFYSRDKVLALMAEAQAAMQPEDRTEIQNAKFVRDQMISEAHETIEQQAMYKAMQEFIRQLGDVFARRFPSCRDCADEAGICPQSTLPCEWPDFKNNLSALAAHDAEKDKAIEHKNNQLTECVLQLNESTATIEQLQARVAELREALLAITEPNALYCKALERMKDKSLESTSTQWLDNKLIEAKIEALEEAAVIAQTNSDSNVDGGDYACGCCYEIRRMAADLQKRH